MTFQSLGAATAGICCFCCFLGNTKAPISARKVSVVVQWVYPLQRNQKPLYSHSGNICSLSYHDIHTRGSMDGNMPPSSRYYSSAGYYPRNIFSVRQSAPHLFEKVALTAA